MNSSITILWKFSQHPFS